MTGVTTIAIARVPLARAPLRLLAAPALLVLIGAVALAAGLVLEGLGGIALLVAGAAFGGLGLYLAVMLFSVRLDVEVASLWLRWLGGERRFALVRGVVTRVPLEGEGAARVRARFGAAGWALGRARLRGEETIQVVQLAPAASLILVPTDQGRLAVAPQSEQQLLAALGTAARVQQRLDEVAARTRSVVMPPPVDAIGAPTPPPVAAAPLPEPRPSHMLTGIERQQLEVRLAAERAAALAAAEAERQAVQEAQRLAAERAAAMAAAEAEAASALVPAVPTSRTLPALTRPAWLHMPSVSRPTVALPRMAGPSAESMLAYTAVALPTLAAAAVYLFAALAGRLDLPGVELRSATLALVLAGPGSALGGLLARAWFPRYLGLVTVTAMCTLVLVGRALLG